MVRKTSNRVIFHPKKAQADKVVTFRAGVKLESGCWLWCIHWFWSQLRDADGQITFLKRTETRRDQNAIFTHRGRKIFANNCTQGYCKLLTTLTVCSYIQQSFKVTSRSLQLPEVLTTAAAVYVTVVALLLLRHCCYVTVVTSDEPTTLLTWRSTVYLLPLFFCNVSGDVDVSGDVSHFHIYIKDSYCSFLLSDARALRSSDSHFFTAKK